VVHSEYSVIDFYFLIVIVHRLHICLALASERLE
jgi:hypothetical protein